MSINSLPNSNSLRSSSFSDNLSLQSDKASQPSLSGRETLSPLHNRTLAPRAEPKWFNPFSWCSSSNTSGRQAEITVPRHPKNIERQVSFQSPLENDKLLDKAAEQFLKEDNEEQESTVSGFLRSDSVNSHSASNDTVEQDSNDVKTAAPEVSTLSPTLADEKQPALMNYVKASKRANINFAAGKGINETFLTRADTKNFLSSNPPPIGLKEAVPSPLEHDDTLGQTMSALFNEKEAVPSPLEHDHKLGQTMSALFNEKEVAPSPLEHDDTLGQTMNALFNEQEAISSSLKGSAAIESWFEKNADNLDQLDHSQTKALSQFEKKYPEALKNRLVNQLVEAYQSDKPGAADSQLKSIRQHLSPQLMASIDQSIIDTLNTTGKSTAAELYEAKHVAMLPMHYEDVLKLDQLAKDLQAGRSLDRAGQEKLLADAKAMLEKMDTQSFTPEQQALMKAAKERVANLEGALPLVDNSKVNGSDILKTLVGSGGLAVCMTAIGALISLLVKLGQSGAVDETESGEEAVSDQSDTIEAKKSEVEAKQKATEDLKAQEKALLDQGANLTEEAVRKNAEDTATKMAIENGDFTHRFNEMGGISDIKPDAIGERFIKESVDESLAQHREKQTAFNAIQSEIKAAEGDLKTLQGELEDLKLQQGQYEGQKNSNPTSSTLQSNHTQAETAILASLGIGALAITGGASGLFAVNSSKILPKFKLHRANTQAVKSLNKVAQSNQPPLSAVSSIDLINSESIIRRNTL